MAKTLKSYEFKSAAAKAIYDWDNLLNGKIWQLEAGSDYECKDATFATLARNAAKKQGKVVRVAKEEGGLVIQAEAASKEQLAKWAEAAKKAAEDGKTEEDE